MAALQTAEPCLDSSSQLLWESDVSAETNRSRLGCAVKWLLLITLVPALLAGAVYGGYRLRLWHQVKARLEAIRADGYPITLSELNAYYPVPAGRNAADVYTRAFALLSAADAKPLAVDVELPTMPVKPVEYGMILDAPDEAPGGLGLTDPDGSGPLPDPKFLLPFVGSGEVPPPDEPLPEHMSKVLALYLEQREDVIGLLHEAATIPEVRYPLDLTQGGETQLPHLNSLRESAFVLALDMLLRAERDDAAGVVRDARSIAALGDSLRKEPLLISMLVRIAVHAIGLAHMDRFLSRVEFTDEQLRELSPAFASITESEVLRRAFAGERSFVAAIFGAPERELAKCEGALDGMGAVGELVFRLYRVSGQLQRDELRCMDLIEEQINMTTLPSSRAWKASGILEAELAALPRKHILIHMVMPAIGSMHRKQAGIVARYRSLDAACALERYWLRHGRYPARSAELVPELLDTWPIDPFDGNTVRYRPTERGYVLHSIGQDAIDDGGDATRIPGWGSKDNVLRVERPQAETVP